ncbi:prenyltransferase/squalene oxidase repeat-containing protein [Limnoglobus roseus]|uniref:Squalene--hopene cyclase n=1 Tax=Limnoglobus roseus TaxID=2598579 RepID=A0A5C1AB72_9BACT|nr:prenyltransferase/squalene oxidase repeat-containing protein [Limnoglobus roseus]QEL16481.1 squalene--hopene cyclase [Limnoglobus roseus]
MTTREGYRFDSAYLIARDALLAERTPDGYWVGELSTSALSTAVAVIALYLVDAEKHHAIITGGLRWLSENQNADGGWGDTVKSFSNISTSMLCRATFAIAKAENEFAPTVQRLEAYLDATCGRSPAERAEAIRNRYGKDRTFSVPILMTCALAELVPWREVPRLPFALACLPQSWYRFLGFPVVSYALPALIAIGQCVHHHRPTWNPVLASQSLAKSPSLKVLRRIQPSSGGYLEATPLTAFVTMSLASIGKKDHEVAREGVRFLVDSVRPDGSWPIDTNLSIWVTTLSVNALAAAGDLDALSEKEKLLTWLLGQQTKERHPYTGADPGAWGWSHHPGSVPDCDDTPGALMAARSLDPAGDLGDILRGLRWVCGLQNRDGGWPTFCRGWGKLPFDRSGADLTAHALRAFQAAWGDAQQVRFATDPPMEHRFLHTISAAAVPSGLDYLRDHQRPDGSWLPLWFGNQHAADDINPVYGTARVLAAYRDWRRKNSEECQNGVSFLLNVQNTDGGWGGANDCPSSVEETAVAVEVLLDLAPGPQVERGVLWLIEAVESGRFREPSPIGFYFAKLWYFEKLYPLIFTVAALGRARVTSSRGAGSV